MPVRLSRLSSCRRTLHRGMPLPGVGCWQQGSQTPRGTRHRSPFPQMFSRLPAIEKRQEMMCDDPDNGSIHTRPSAPPAHMRIGWDKNQRQSITVGLSG